MFKIAIVEDQEETRESLNRFVRQYAQEQGLQVVIRRIVQKYKGTLTLEEQGEFFAEKIIFPLQK